MTSMVNCFSEHNHDINVSGNSKVNGSLHFDAAISASWSPQSVSRQFADRGLSLGLGQGWEVLLMSTKLNP